MSVPDPATVPVAVHGFTWSAAAGWSTFVAIIGGIALALRNIGPMTTKLAELIINRGDKLRAEDREEELTLTQRLDALEKRASTAERRLGFVTSACTTLLSALELVEPNNPALKQARDQLAMAAGRGASEDAFADMLAQLGRIPPVDRNPHT